MNVTFGVKNMQQILHNLPLYVLGYSIFDFQEIVGGLLRRMKPTPPTVMREVIRKCLQRSSRAGAGGSVQACGRKCFGIVLLLADASVFGVFTSDRWRSSACTEDSASSKLRIDIPKHETNFKFVLFH